MRAQGDANSKSTTTPPNHPDEYQFGPDWLALRQQFSDASSLDGIVREGARRMLQTAIDAEVEVFVEQHQYRLSASGRRLVVKNGCLTSREIVTGAEPSSETAHTWSFFMCQDPFQSEIFPLRVTSHIVCRDVLIMRS
jgi:hypothetical protein